MHVNGWCEKPLNLFDPYFMLRNSTRLGRALVAALFLAVAAPAQCQTAATGGPGDHASWTTGNKLAVGTSSDTTSTVWFTVAKGITTEVFYPRLDIPNMQDMQYIITDGSSFADLERDATSHVVAMPDEKALEFTVTNTDKRATPKYRITNTYITDPNRSTLLIRTRFQSLDGGAYQLYLLDNPSIAGSGANNNAWWDGTNTALMASGTETVLGSSISVVSALVVASPNGFVAHDNGYAGTGSDCMVDLAAHMRLQNHFDTVDGNGNVVQCGEIGNLGTDTTFTVALGYGSDSASATVAANGSLATGFSDREAAYRAGWNSYINGLRAAPASVASDIGRRRAYYVALMALHAAEDKTFRGASVAGFATPWGAAVSGNGDNLNDGYHRVWGRDLYQQAIGLIAAGDSAQALRMAQFMWNSQYIGTSTPGDGTTYPSGSFPRYSPVSGISGTPPPQLGCCEQFDQASFAMVLAWMTGLTDAATYQKIKVAANRIQTAGPDTTERWEEQKGKSVSSVAAEIAGLVAAADIARQNGDPASGTSWEATADVWSSSLAGWTFTTVGHWGTGHYYERIDISSSPNDSSQVQFDEGKFYAHDIVDYGFLDLVRLGERLPNDSNVSLSLSPTAAAFDGNSAVQMTMPNGDIYFHRYNHDNYGEDNTDCTGWRSHNPDSFFGRLWPVLSGERGEYELANGRSASIYLQSMADAANDGYFLPEQVWDRADISCFVLGRPTGSAAPLNWAEGQYLRLSQSIDAGYNVDTPSVVKARYRGAGPILGDAGKCIEDAGAGTANGTAIQIQTCSGASQQSWIWSSGDGTLRVFGKCMTVAGGGTTNGTHIQLSDCDGTGSQQWRWRKQSLLVNPQSDRCLDARGTSSDGAQLQIRDCNGAATQLWHLR
jgi:glucoamylase